MSYYLGIHDGHTATACLLKEGRIVGCISEERINRIKEYSGFPKASIQTLLEMEGIGPESIKAIGIASIYFPYLPTEELANYRPNLLKKKLKRILKHTPIWEFHLRRARRRRISYLKSKLEVLGLGNKPMRIYDHHFTHASTAYFASGANERKLVITLDGSGDFLSGSIWIMHGRKFEKLSSIPEEHSLGKFYSDVTSFLGMKRLSHEYKVMGLAGYVDENNEHAKEVLSKLGELFKVDDLNILSSTNDYYAFLKKHLIGKRFDYIAFGAQKTLEDVVLNLVRNAIRKTGISNVVLSGGVFMNVKLNNLILHLDEVDELFVMPSCGDESLAIGSAYLVHTEMENELPHPIKELYFGKAYTQRDVEKALDEFGNFGNISVSKFAYEDVDRFLAERIAEGKVVARFRGRMEWGARALGNRSILADPRNPKIVRKINKAIKKRDFWMPFAPTILYEDADEYLVNPKGHFAPYMIIAFATKSKAHDDIIASLHPYDLTCRPQVLRKDFNPSYYELVKHFKQLTGVGAVLNTSFNLHGEPIVMSPKDALHTFMNSDLDILAMENIVLERK